MKIKGFTYLSLLVVGLIASTFFLAEEKKEHYFPRTNTYFTEYERGIKGAQEYWSSIRNNRETGFISTEEIMNAQLVANKLRNNSKSLGINWSSKGPDNVGGRTRAIIIDVNDTSHIYTGGVSGGVWESFDGAITWQPYDVDYKISNVSSMAQGPDGTVYVGTGSSFDGTSNPKSTSSHFVGTGLYKLTGNGNSELLIGPTTSNSFTFEWTAVNDLAVNPNDKDHIIAAISTGLMQSTDGGENWTRAPFSLFESYHDVQFSSDGNVVATSRAVIHVSQDEGKTYTSNSFSGMNRIEVAIAPSNSDIMYALMARGNGCTGGVYRSFDTGANWEELGFTPDIFGGNCQGFYDNEIVVYPDNPEKIIVGGIGLFQWNQSSTDPAPIQGEWKSIATTFSTQGTRNPFYVHADKHIFVFNPENPNTLYLGSDGGISVSFNANSPFMSFSESNLGLNITQFYDIGAGPNDQVIGGTQDNGSPLVGFAFNTGRNGIDAFGGDGFDAHLSTINPQIGLVSSQFGSFARLQGVGTTLSNSTINTANIVSQTLGNICGRTNVSCAPNTFYTSTGLWESFKHEATKDSVLVTLFKRELPPIRKNTKIEYKSKNNDWPMVGTLEKRLFPTDTIRARFNDLEINNVDDNTTQEFIVNYDTIVVDLASDEITFKYREWDSVEVRNITFNSPMLWRNVFDTSAAPQLFVSVDTNVNASDLSIKYNEIDLEFLYQKEFSDSVQSMANIANVIGISANERNIWMTRDLLKGGSVEVPRWFKIAGAISTPDPIRPFENVIANEFSRDGNYLFLGTIFGAIYRVDNLNDIDISQIPFNVPVDSIIENFTSCHRIGTFLNRSVTGIAIDPNNGNNVIVTLGNYGQSNYVVRSTNALSSNPSFQTINGSTGSQLPLAPAYDAVIDFRDSNTVLVATELGVFATENAFDADPTNVVWTEENGGMGRAPATSLEQMIFGYDVGAKNQGVVYVGTHGRGIYRTDHLVGLDENINAEEINGKTKRPEVNIYPNPVRNIAKVGFEINDVSVPTNLKLYNIKGQVVYENNLLNLRKGKNLINLNLSDFENGTYIIRIVSNNKISTGKLIKN